MTEPLPPPDSEEPEAKIFKRRGPGLNIFLFIATLFTTWLAGANGETEHEALTNGFMYMGSIMAILLSHEMGHYILARRNRIEATLPFFIPFPFGPLGTWGALIAMKGRIRSRDALMEVGAAGPLAGIAVAIPVIIIGVALSPVRPLQPSAVLEGQSLLYMLLKWVAVGPIPEGHDVFLHPMAWAGWVGLLVTMVNLLPVGQLDGGHVSYALFGKAHARVSLFVIIGMIVYGLALVWYAAHNASLDGLEGETFYLSISMHGNWLFWGILLFIFFGRGRRRRHPPTDDERLSPRHRAVGIACVVLFVITFMPVPLQILF